MAYDDSVFRRRDTSTTEPMGRGPRDDTRFQPDTAFGADSDFGPPSYESSDYREPDTAESTPGMHQRRVPPAVLDDVFDDPEHGDPGRDRLGVHFIWEIILLLAVGAVAYLIYDRDADALRGDGLRSLLVFAAALGLLALGAGLTMRAGAANLAIGAVAVATALHFAENGDRGVLDAGGTAAAVAAAGGIAIAIMVVGFHVPGWAASLGAALGVVVYIQQRTAPVNVQGGYDPTDHALYLFGGMAALAMLGGLLGTIKSVRRAVGRFRPVADPAKRRGRLAGLIAAGAIVVSMIFASGAGVLLASGGTGPVVPDPGLQLLGLGLGAALLGGVSAFGRRGGVFGTLLAVVLLALIIRHNDLRDWNVSLYAIGAVAIGVGLIITRVVETFGRPPAPRTAEDDDEWPEPGSGEAAAPVWSSPPRQESWSSALPAQPTAGRSDPWEDDRWNTAR
jgi:ribose/xylose/arabinose/galactoside ABC-type transport system permease subunit